MSWSGKKIKDTFKDLLKINSASDNAGVDTNLREVQDGSGGPTGLKLSETAVDAATFTSSNSTITNAHITSLNGAIGPEGSSGTSGTIGHFNSTDVTIEGGTIDNTSIGLSLLHPPREIIASRLGINKSASGVASDTNDIGDKDASKFSVYTTERNSDVAFRSSAGFDHHKVYHDLNGYFCASHDNKSRWTALEFITPDGDTKGTAWWELEMWVEESNPAIIGSGSGTGYSEESPPLLRCIPRDALNAFPNAQWTPNTPVLKGDQAVVWGVVEEPSPVADKNIGYVWEVTFTSLDANGLNTGSHTGNTSPLYKPFTPQTYGTEVSEGSITGTDYIKWEYIGQTARMLAAVDGGAVTAIEVLPDRSNGVTDWLQGFSFVSVTGSPNNELGFFDFQGAYPTDAYPNGQFPITLEKGPSGGEAASASNVTYDLEISQDSGWEGWRFKIKIKSSGGNIAEGQHWALVQKNSSGTVIRHMTLATTIIGGRGGASLLWIAPPPVSGQQAAGGLSMSPRIYGPSGISGATLEAPIGELLPQFFSATGERTYFARHKGFIMSREAYDKSAVVDSDSFNYGHIIDGLLYWWNNPRQKEKKKGQILDGIKYGNTNLGHMHNFDPTHITPDADSNQHAKNQFDKAAGKVYILSGSSAADWSIAESTTEAVFFKTGASGSSTPELSFTTEAYGGIDDYEFNKTIYDAAFAATGGTDAVKEIAAKAATLEFPNFGNISPAIGAAPGGTIQVDVTMKTALDMLDISATENVHNMHLPAGSNEGSFYLTFDSYNTNTGAVGIGYRLKCWTTPGYVVNLRRTTGKYP